MARSKLRPLEEAVAVGKRTTSLAGHDLAIGNVVGRTQFAGGRTRGDGAPCVAPEDGGASVVHHMLLRIILQRMGALAVIIADHVPGQHDGGRSCECQATSRAADRAEGGSPCRQVPAGPASSASTVIRQPRRTQAIGHLVGKGFGQIDPPHHPEIRKTPVGFKWEFPKNPKNGVSRWREAAGRAAKTGVADGSKRNGKVP